MEALSEEEEENNDDEKIPLLYVEVNLGKNRKKKIVVHEGDKAEDLAEDFAKENSNTHLFGEIPNFLFRY